MAKAKRTSKSSTSKSTSKVIRMTADVAKKLLYEYGFAVAKTYDNATLAKHMNNLPETSKTYTGTIKPNVKSLIAKLKAGAVVKVVAEKATGEAKPKAKATGEAKPKAKATGEAKPKAKATGEAKPKARKAAGNVDKFGSRIGSKRADVNKLLSRKWQPMSVWVEAFGDTFYNHFKGLVEKGLIEKSEQGYRLAK